MPSDLEQELAYAEVRAVDVARFEHFRREGLLQQAQRLFAEVNERAAVAVARVADLNAHRAASCILVEKSRAAIAHTRQLLQVSPAS